MDKLPAEVDAISPPKRHHSGAEARILAAEVDIILPPKRTSFRRRGGHHFAALEMDASKEARFKALTEELAALLYEETDPGQVKTLAGIEEAIRGHLLERVGPELGNFLLQQAAAQQMGENGGSKALSDN